MRANALVIWAVWCERSDAGCRELKTPMWKPDKESKPHTVQPGGGDGEVGMNRVGENLGIGKVG